MTSEPRAFFAIDHGAATTSAALVGRVGGRWRLLGSVAVPKGPDLDQLIGLLVARVRRADPAIAAQIGAADATPAGEATSGEPIDLAVLPDAVRGPVREWPRLVARTAPSRTIAVLAPSERRRARLEGAATSAGWQVLAGSLERMDALELTTLVLQRSVSTVVIGAGEPASPDERAALRTLGPLLAAAVGRRPELTVVLAGGASVLQAMIVAAGARSDGATDDRAASTGGGVVVVPDAPASNPADSGLRAALAQVRAADSDTRRAIARSTSALAAALDRRVETVEVGLGGGTRVAAWPRAGGPEIGLRSAVIAGAGLVGPEPEDAVIDGVVSWFSQAIDRPRLRDRLRELWLAPWADANGEGALLRMAVGRAALARLVEATPEFDDLPNPDVIVVAGGVWAVAPAPAVVLAVVDTVRRAGVSQVVYDHARLLGPIGTIADDEERRALLADLADDAFVPFGTAIVPQGLRAGRVAGRASMRRPGDDSLDEELVAGQLVTLDVPPGESGTAELEFRDPVTLGVHGKRFAVEVAGGLGGVLVDLRDVPLRLPDRLERRRELLASWQDPMWSPLES